MSSNKLQKDVSYNENISNVVCLCRKFDLFLKVKTKDPKEEPTCHFKYSQAKYRKTELSSEKNHVHLMREWLFV